MCLYILCAITIFPDFVYLTGCGINLLDLPIISFAPNFCIVNKFLKRYTPSTSVASHRIANRNLTTRRRDPNEPLMRQSQQMPSLFSSAEMFKKPLWQTLWAQIRLLL